MTCNTFTYSWRITEFSLCAHAKGDAIDSHSFETQVLRNTKWTLQLFPRGNKKADHVAFYLQRCTRDDGPEVVQVQVTFQLLASDGSLAVTKQTQPSLFRNGLEIGSNELIKRSDLFENAETYLQNDVLNLRCVLKLVEVEQFHTKHVFSRTTIPVEKSVFDWQVENFSKLTEKDTVSIQILFKSMTERYFDASLRVGMGEDENVYIEFCRSENPKESSSVLKARVTVLDSEGVESSLWREDRHCCEPTETWVFPVFLNRMKLLKEKRKYLENDVLTLKCELTVSAGPAQSQIDKTIRSSAPDPHTESKSQLALDMSRLYQEMEYADIQLRAATTDDGSGGETVLAHKSVLQSRSKKFSSMLEEFELDGGQRRGVLDTNLDLATLKNLLKYLYTDELNEMSYKDVESLYVSAYSYEIESLKYKCSLYLQSLLKVGNVCSLLQMASDLEDTELKHSAVNFLSRYWEEVSLSDDWLKLSKDRKKLANEIKEKLLVQKLYFS